MDSLGPTKVAGFGGLHYWKDGRDVPDLLMGMYDYPQTEAHPAFQLSLRCNFEAGGGGNQGFRFIGTDGVLNLTVGTGFTVTRRPAESEPGHTFDTFDKANAERGVSAYLQKYPRQRPTADGLRGIAESSYKLPSGYTEQYAHHENFFRAVRERSSVVEDASFGFRATAPALLSNLSYFENKMCVWDPVAMQAKS